MSRARLAVAALAVLLAGCAREGGTLGAGPTVDFCVGYREYAALEEPSPDRPDQVERYAAGAVRVVDRIKLRLRIELPKGPPLVLPPSVEPDLRLVKARMLRLRDEARAAHDDPARVRRAVNDLADDQALVDADARLEDFVTARCPRK